MKSSPRWILCVLLVVSVFTVLLFAATSASADSLSEAIKQGLSDGKIAKGAEPGFFRDSRCA